MKSIALAGLLSGALLLGSPLQGHAEPGKGRGHANGKGWRSERGEKRVERRVERGVRAKGNSKAFRGSEGRVTERGTVKRSTVRRGEERVVRGVERGTSRPRTEGRVVRETRTRQSRSYDRNDRVVRSGDRVRSDQVRSDRYRRDYSYRAPSRTRIQTSYRAPRWSGGRYYTGARYYTAYRGYPVYREYVSYRVAPAYAPYYGWRYYCAPRYDYGGHVIYVQPVRFFLAADFVIGGVGISARYADPGPVYGCNFCDARFGSYYDYEAHVEHHCGHIPHGYVVHAADWQDQVWDHEDDGGYYEDDGGYYEDDGY